MISNENWLRIGKLVTPQGLHGEIRVKPYSDFEERFTQPGKRWLKNKEETDLLQVKLISGRRVPGKEIFVVRFAEINNRTEAEKLIGANLLVPSSDRPKLAENEFHLLDLVGLEARLKPNGPLIGMVTNLTNGGNDLLEIKLLEGRTVLIPFVHAIVPVVDLKEGWLLLTPPPGLLEL
ncbi:ribosome maturation factor RimM [Prochlorococcus sp. MIT 1307]|uniref:ribosome maturation factor RimM n=1 Tax=Prochlorococcus sp. MIT 1307 TaxID=3096219 RepID=UPI002A762A36|nr:ribosome maturation factor RimM [Prochlorococcus sp. MIT 1307]